MIVLILLVVVRRRPGRDRAAVLPELDDRSRSPGVKPYAALQLAGRDIYVREGCYNCHSQMIRPLRAETERYGHYSVAGEFVYDHPFQWGCKRTGPDLARVGGRYTDEWHRVHLINPRDVVPESNMPAYPVAGEDARSTRDGIAAHMRALRTLGVPTPTRRSPRRRRASTARPSWTPWSPTCRGSASTRRGEAEHDVRNRAPLMLLVAVPRRLGLGLEPARARASFDAAARLPLDDDDGSMSD